MKISSLLRSKPGTIRYRLQTSFALIALLPVLSATLVSGALGVYYGDQQARDRLSSLALSKETAIRGWIEALHQELVTVSTTDCSYERIWIVVSLATNDLIYEFYNNAVRNRLRAFTTQSSLYDEMFLIDAQGRIVLSTDRAFEGRDASTAEFFQQGLRRPFTSLPFSPHLEAVDSASVFIAQPIVSEGQVLGVIVGQARTDTLRDILLERTGLGQTGKTYMVNTDGLFLSGASPSGDPGSDLGWRPDLQAIWETQASGFHLYTDLYGKRVIGAHRWLPDQQAMILVEQNQSEVFATTISTLGINLIVALAALVMAVSLAAVTMRSIANPLQNLVRTATQIAAGDLDQSAIIEKEDEIGALAKAFNSMTEQLRTLIIDLEERVKDRTAKLQRLALQLETSAKVSREVTSILSIDSLLVKITELIENAFGFDAVRIYLVNEKTNSLVFRASSKPGRTRDLHLDLDANSLNNEVVRTCRPLLVNDVSLEPRFMPDPDYPNLRAELVLPLCIGSQCLGTLDLLSLERDTFQAEEVVVVQSLADQIAIAIENARLYERSQELAVLEERNRLARDLHDAMSQSLYSIVLFAGAADKEAEKIRAKCIQSHLARVEGTAQQALKEMRLMLYELRPYSLEEKGLVGALQKRLDAVEGSADIDAKLQVNGVLDLPVHDENALFHIIQEALNNALKHAVASAVRVTIDSQDHQVLVAVVDNGQGFDPSSHFRSGGMGLATMRERADNLGAKLTILSAPGKGTQVHVTLDMPRKKPD